MEADPGGTVVHATQMQMADGGGSSSQPSVQSSITVDPGQIKQFATFLAEMKSEIQSLHDRMDTLGIKPEDFGIHGSSKTAGDAHATALTAAIGNLDRLRNRADELVDGTNELSRLYADTEELNRANAEKVAGALNGEDAADA